MPKEIMWIFAVALTLLVMQSVGTWFQLRDYQQAMRRIRQLGNVGIGQKKGFFGHLVLIACNGDGYITGAEVMEGMTIAARFRPWTHLESRALIGSHINDFLADFERFDERQRHFYKGFLQALEALQQRLYPEEYAARKAEEKASAEERANQKRIKLPVEMMFSSK